MGEFMLAFSPDTDTRRIRQRATFIERASRVWGVNEFVKPIRDHPKVKGTPLQEDMNNFHALVRMHAIELANLHRCGSDLNWGFQYFRVDSQNRLQRQIRAHSNISRLSFATMGNFFIESGLRNIVQDLGGKPEFHHSRLAEQAVRLAKLGDHATHVGRLRVVSMIRNTLHDRGVHSGKSESLTIDGVTFDFQAGKIVRGDASWDHLCHGFASALSTLRNIVEVVWPIT